LIYWHENVGSQFVNIIISTNVLWETLEIEIKVFDYHYLPKGAYPAVWFTKTMHPSRKYILFAMLMGTVLAPNGSLMLSITIPSSSRP
jgi:hypothetical protein